MIITTKVEGRVFTAQGELVVANVFVRVYNEQPTFPVSDPASFCKGLVSYLHMQAQSAWFKDASPAAATPKGAWSIHFHCKPAQA